MKRSAAVGPGGQQQEKKAKRRQRLVTIASAEFGSKGRRKTMEDEHLTVWKNSVLFFAAASMITFFDRLPVAERRHPQCTPEPSRENTLCDVRDL
jgi:hypothetical protein